MKTARQLNSEIAEFLTNGGTGRTSSGLAAKFTAVRRADRETKSSAEHPGKEPQHQSTLSVGREREGWKPLYWKRLLAEYKKETAKRGGLGNAIEIDLWIMHAPDGHTVFTRVDWADPFDVRGAERFARQLIEDGGAQFVEVNARARRPASREEAIYTLANFARDAQPEDAPGHATKRVPRDLSPENALRLDALPDSAICNAHQGGSRNLWYASVALERRWPSDPDFSTAKKTKHEAIRDCAAKVRADLHGEGKYAPHWGHYDITYRLLPYWEQRTGNQD